MTSARFMPGQVSLKWRCIGCATQNGRHATIGSHEVRSLKCIACEATIVVRFGHSGSFLKRIIKRIIRALRQPVRRVTPLGALGEIPQEIGQRGEHLAFARSGLVCHELLGAELLDADHVDDALAVAPRASGQHDALHAGVKGRGSESDLR